jgi:small subunit ribosomal protein S17
MMSEATEAVSSSVDPRRRATRTGVVISSKMDKTVVVAVERQVAHPRYSRVVKRTSKFYAHDETNRCKAGDVVTIVATRPMSRLKRWRVRSVLREGQPILEASVADLAVLEDTGRPAPKHQTSRRKGAAAEEKDATS